MKDKIETYHFYGLDNEIHSVEVDPMGGHIVEISDKHCKFCGCLIAVYDGDPHYISECPNCHIHGEYTTVEKAIEDEEELINTLIQSLNTHNQKINVLKRTNAVYKKNMEDRAMKEKK